MKRTTVKTAAAVSVPYFDLKRQYELLKNEIETAVLSVTASGRYVLGETVENFEKVFADYCGRRFGIGVGSGTDALIFALRALGIGKGDEVIVPSFTFVASVLAIMHAGATPVYAEVDPVTYTLSPESVEKAITGKTRAILPVHLYGQAAQMDALLKIAAKRKLKVVEDACQAHGAEFQGRKTGSFGDAGCFSFYPTKNLGAVGDGGMTLVNHPALAEKIQCLRNLGRRTLSEPNKVEGWTSRLDAIQAAVLSLKLKYLDSFNDKRRAAAQRYRQKLSNTPVILPEEAPGRRHVYHLFVVRVPNGKRDALKEKLAAAGIPTMIHYALPVHRQPATKQFLRKKCSLEFTDQLSKDILSLPIFPEMTQAEVDQVSEVIRNFYA